jgi:hypothetical protein
MVGSCGSCEPPAARRGRDSRHEVSPSRKHASPVCGVTTYGLGRAVEAVAPTIFPGALAPDGRSRTLRAEQNSRRSGDPACR